MSSLGRLTPSELEARYSLSPLNEAHRLREEARESWNYFVTNEIVYEADARDGDAFTSFGYLKEYLRAEVFFELSLSPRGHPYAARAILESFDLAAWGSEYGDNLPARNLDVEPVFVGVPHPVQDRERMVVGLPTVCWLKIDDVGNGIRKNIDYAVPESFDVVGFACADHWKRSEFPRLLAGADEIPESKIPSDVVQSCPQIVDHISQDRPKGDRRRAIWRDLIDSIVEIVRIELTGVSLRVSLNEASHLPFQLVQVLARPYNLDPSPGDIAVSEVLSFHGVDSNHERSTDTEDGEGPRDSRAQAPRLRRRHPQGRKHAASREGEAEATPQECSPPGEVAPETSADRVGCSAKHTHSGSPEDA